MSVICLLSFVLLIPLCCTAARPCAPVIGDPVPEPWRWRHEEALAGLGVLCMDEAPDGTLWFGNTGSIARYDGMTVTTVPFDDELLSKITHDKKSPWAKALIVLPDGNPLVLAGESLVLRSNQTWKVILKDAGPSVFTAHMEQAVDGTVWLIVPGKLWRIEADLSQASVVMESSDDNPLMSFCIDPSGDVWVFEKTGTLTSRLVKIPLINGRPAARTEWREFPVPFDNYKREAVVISAESGLIWLTASRGVETFDSRRNEWVQRKPGDNSQSYYSLLKSRDGSIWAGGESDLLRVSGGAEEVRYSVEELNLPVLPMSLFETKSGRMWVIGRIGSVYSVDPGDREWRTYKGLNYQCETPEGLRWFTSTRYRSVVSQNLKTGEWLEYGPEEGVIDSTFNVIRSSQGLIWAAGSHQKRAAFSVYDGVNWTRFCHPELLRRFEPNAVLEAADGTVWMGVGGDIANSDLSCGGAVRYKINPDRSVELLSRHAPPDFPYYVTALAQTSDQVLWLGSTEVYRYDGLSPRAQPAAFLQGSRTIGMFVDSNQTVWVAKECFGVCRWRNDSWEVFGINEGLPSLNLRGMCLLQDGSIVVSSDKGISRFDGTIWKAEACPEWFRMIQRRSGIKQSGDGSFWFNYDDSEPQFAKISKETGGFCTVHHRPETDPPETWVAECLARVSPPGNSHIRWAGNDLWSVTPVKDLQYSWRLNGGGWSAFSHETGKTFLKLNSGRHILEVRARDRAFNIDPTPARVEFVVIPPVWRQPWFLTLVFVLVGLILSLTWLLIRSRERHLLERQADRENLLKRQQEDRERHLLEMDRLKTGFFTNISHELRTPMTVVCGRLETFLGSESDEQKKNALSVILRNAQRVTGLIAQLLDFRKIEEGKIAVEATKGDLVPSLRDWMASLQVLADQAQISLHLESVETCCGWFDFDKLQKIFTNLIANSIKYTMAGGEVRVYLNVEGDHCRAETVEDLSAARLEGQEPFQPCKKTSGRRLRFVVEDTGVGIAKEHQAHIFKPFYRVSEASMAQGAGIGLNLTRELVELLGGTIRVESPIHEDVNRPGSRFTVQLPMDLAQSRKDAKDGENGDLQSAGLCASAPLREESSELYTSNRSDSSNEESPLILVVEDDEEVRAFIVEGLESSCRVETAEDGLIGLQKAKEQVPDLIITDLMMPGMDGIALCKELKTSMETSHIPVIMLTAKASLEHQVEGLQTGADDYITKPFHMILLQTRIHNLLEARRVLREQFCREYPVLTSTTLESKVDKEFIDKALRVVEENYTDARFDLDEFAAALNISRRSLQRKLKAVADQTPLGFITEFRMMQAAKLLTGTENTIADICFQVGCDEPSNFYRLFKKYYQMSPSQYRAEKGGL